MDFRCLKCCRRNKDYKPRSVPIGLEPSSDVKYPKNVIRNQKYSVITFIPKVRVFVKEGHPQNDD